MKRERERKAVASKMKKEGTLPWKHWYNDDDYEDYKEVMRQYFKPLENANDFHLNRAPNVTIMSAEQYDYYIVNTFGHFKGNGTTWVILMGSTHENNTLWCIEQLQHSVNILYNETGDYDYKENDIHFAVVEPRYDEPLSEAYDLRRFPTLYIIDPEEGEAYAFDKYKWPCNQTIVDLIVNETYKESNHHFKAPRVVFKEEFQKIYITKWFRN
jgi:hypothetical protein